MRGMTKLETIAAAKQFRKDGDTVLQSMKDHRKQLMEAVRNEPQLDKEFLDTGEAIAQHTLAIRDLESSIMRLGMSLKYIGNPTPYPESYNPASPIVEPTADGLKM